jgi:hypothetical protein
MATDENPILDDNDLALVSNALAAYREDAVAFLNQANASQRTDQ